MTTLDYLTLDQAIDQVASKTQSPAVRIVLHGDHFALLSEKKNIVWSNNGHYWGPYRCTISDKLAINEFVIKCGDGSEHGFVLTAAKNHGPQCWCGLAASVRAGGYGGIHQDYCNPELAGKPG